jgi:hypothetical protein
VLLHELQEPLQTEVGKVELRVLHVALLHELEHKVDEQGLQTLKIEAGVQGAQNEVANVETTTVVERA